MLELVKERWQEGLPFIQESLYSTLIKLDEQDGQPLLSVLKMSAVKRLPFASCAHTTRDQ